MIDAAKACRVVRAARAEWRAAGLVLRMEESCAFARNIIAPVILTIGAVGSLVAVPAVAALSVGRTCRHLSRMRVSPTRTTYHG